MTKLPQSRSCFACGDHNPQGLNLRFNHHGDSIQTQWIPQSHQTGFANTIHGGLIATVLDEIMAWTCGIIGGRFAYSVDLQIHYTHPLEPLQTVIGTGEMEENRRARIFHTRANLKVGDQEIASATGKYLAVKASVEEGLWAEFGPAAETLQASRKQAKG